MLFNSIDSVMQGPTQVMGLIAKRQKLLGENLANMDTPGYTRQDMDFGQYMGETVSPLEAKLVSKFGPAPVFTNTSRDEVNPSNELMELQKNSLLYTMATRQMTSTISDLKTVINVGK